MPKLKTFKIEGLILKFNSLDHMEPHFHVIKPGGKWEIRIYFLTCTEVFLHFEYKKPPNPPMSFDGISKGERKELLEQIIKHRTQLFDEWQRKVEVAENHNANT